LSKETRYSVTITFQLASESGIREDQENQVGLKLNGSHLLLNYVDDVNVLGDNISMIKKNTETLDTNNVVRLK
jgi:hypothetical protein